MSAVYKSTEDFPMSLAAAALNVTPEQYAKAYQELGAFVAIPSVSNPESPDHKPEHLGRAAVFAGDRLSEIGFHAELISVSGSAPYVVAEKIVDIAKPTILFYAHYDVQPVEREKWTQKDPFVMEERDGRLYGRGACDDKAGIIGIITALGAYQKAYGALPVNVKILFEGEEEYGSSHLSEFIRSQGDRLKSDAMVIFDGGSLDTNTGTLTNSTRGLVNLHVQVKSMAAPVHSGVGCMVPDPSQTLVDLLHSLRDPRAIPHFMDSCKRVTPEEAALLDLDSQTTQEYARDHRLVPTAELRGDPAHSVYHRITAEPSISFVNGGWGSPNGGNSIQNTAAAQVGIRLTSGQDPAEVSRLVRDHLLAQPNQGLEVTVQQNEAGVFAWQGNAAGPFSQMYLAAMREHFPRTHVQPCGGAMPINNEMEKAFPNTEIVFPGPEDPDCGAHSHDESLHKGLFEKHVESMISFLRIAGTKA